MKKLALRFGGVGFLYGVAVVLPALAAPKNTIKDLMKKLNSGPESLRPKIGGALKSDEPDWDALQKNTKQFAELAAELTDLMPPQGEKESWEKLTKAYIKNARALEEAAKNKDRAAAKSANARIGGSCRACHDAHKPKTQGF